MAIQTKAFPRVLSFSQAKFYIFSLVFTGLSVLTPTIFHQFNLAGPRFLPMHIFVILAGLLFGWRAGLLVGVLSPLMSYGLTRMPAMAILPEVVLELGVYGLIAGLLAERKINIWISLLSAMILGRLARVLFVLISDSETSPLNYFQLGWPGMVLQLALIPLIVYLLQKFFFKNGKTI